MVAANALSARANGRELEKWNSNADAQTVSSMFFTNEIINFSISELELWSKLRFESPIAHTGAG